VIPADAMVDRRQYLLNVMAQPDLNVMVWPDLIMARPDLNMARPDLNVMARLDRAICLNTMLITMARVSRGAMSWARGNGTHDRCEAPK